MEQINTADTLAPEFCQVKNADGGLCGFVREIPQIYFADGSRRWAMFDARKKLIGSCMARDKAVDGVREHAHRLDTWATVPFGGRKDKVAL